MNQIQIRIDADLMEWVRVYYGDKYKFLKPSNGMLISSAIRELQSVITGKQFIYKEVRRGKHICYVVEEINEPII